MNDSLPEFVYRSELVKAVRHRRDWTQAELASALGVTRNVVSAWEQGGNLPTHEAVDALLEVWRGEDWSGRLHRPYSLETRSVDDTFIASLMDDLGVGVNLLAAWMGVSQATMQALLAGGRTPDQRERRALLEVRAYFVDHGEAPPADWRPLRGAEVDSAAHEASPPGDGVGEERGAEGAGETPMEDGVGTPPIDMDPVLRCFQTTLKELNQTPVALERLTEAIEGIRRALAQSHRQGLYTFVLSLIGALIGSALVVFGFSAL